MITLTQVTMGDEVYVLVQDDGEPSVWEHGEDVKSIRVFDDFWRARRDVWAKGRQIRALTRHDLEELLRGRWSHITHVLFHPSPTAYQVSKEKLFAA